MAEELWTNASEVLQIMAKIKLSLNLEPNSIEGCHRVGIRTVNNKRPILMKFISYDGKHEVIKNRR